jgi:hypothetical protein
VRARAFLVVVAAMVFLSAAVALADRRSVSSVGSCNGGKPPPRSISAIQAIQFELMAKSSFNYFDGPRVVRDLRNHRRLWCGVVMETGDGSLLNLRDIGDKPLERGHRLHPE